MSDNGTVETRILGLFTRFENKVEGALNRIIDRIEAVEKASETRFADLEARAARAGMVSPGTMITAGLAIFTLISAGATLSYNVTMRETAARAAEEKAVYMQSRIETIKEDHAHELEQERRAAEMKVLLQLALTSAQKFSPQTFR